MTLGLSIKIGKQTIVNGWHGTTTDGRQFLLETLQSEGRQMRNAAPHYLLLSETQVNRHGSAGNWRFVLERMDGSGRIEVADEEPEMRGERLQLLAVVRGLEALEQPSRVTLITPSSYVGRGIRNGLDVWRENDWKWERFGEMIPVKNADLWKRIDHALDFHVVDCRVWNFSQIEFNEYAATSARNRLSGQFRNNAATRRSNRPSWSEIASAIAQRVNPFRQSQAYGCV